MSRSDDLRLLDILEASDRIDRLVARGPLAFSDDEAIQPAIERMLEIIGERQAGEGFSHLDRR